MIQSIKTTLILQFIVTQRNSLTVRLIQRVDSLQLQEIQIVECKRLVLIARVSLVVVIRFADDQRGNGHRRQPSELRSLSSSSHIFDDEKCDASDTGSAQHQREEHRYDHQMPSEPNRVSARGFLGVFPIGLIYGRNCSNNRSQTQIISCRFNLKLYCRYKLEIT